MAQQVKLFVTSPQNPHGGKGELTPISCPHTAHITHTHTHTLKRSPLLLLQFSLNLVPVMPEVKKKMSKEKCSVKPPLLQMTFWYIHESKTPKRFANGHERRHWQPARIGHQLNVAVLLRYAEVSEHQINLKWSSHPAREKKSKVFTIVKIDSWFLEVFQAPGAFLLFYGWGIIGVDSIAFLKVCQLVGVRW